MIKTTIMNENIGGAAFNILHFAALVPTKNYIICFPGMGECHATDTTKITNFDWYPKYANNGTLEADFNIIAIQPHLTTTLYGATGYGVINHCILKYGIKNIVTVGLSLGGSPAFSALYKDTAGLIRGVVSFGGTVVNNTSALYMPVGANLNTAKDVPTYIYHHTSDTTVTLASVQTFVNGVNSGTTRAFPMTITQFAASTHNEWAGKMTENKTLPAYTFITSRFNTSDCSSCKEQGRQEIIALLKGFIDSIE